ncbi:unnamed protein product, partial [Iphiclides podalirius]
MFSPTQPRWHKSKRKKRSVISEAHNAHKNMTLPSAERHVSLPVFFTKKTRNHGIHGAVPAKGRAARATAETRALSVLTPPDVNSLNEVGEE